MAKPAATTPLATLEVARLFAEAGVPDGVLNVVTGRGAEIGDALVGHPDVRRVAFTGSTAVGRHVCRSPARSSSGVTLELGGSDPVIVCEDADVDAAVKAVIIGRYWNAGQACLGCKRVFVHDSVYDDFVSQLVDRVGRYEPGDGTVKAEKPRLRMGPIHTRAGPRRAARADRGRRRQGRRAAHRRRHRRPRQGLVPRAGGGRRAGAPTRAWCTEEVFGPVLPVFRFTDFDDAHRARQRHAVRPRLVDLDARRAQRSTARRRRSTPGMTWVNQIHYGYDELPFGGSRTRASARSTASRRSTRYVELKSVVVGGLA